VQQVRLALAQGTKRTVFFGLRALRPIEGLRLALAGTGAQDQAVMPPSCVYLWRVVEPSAAPARLEPFAELSLAEGQLTYIAMTVDAGRLEPGSYSGRLIVTAGQNVRDVPVSLQVMPAPTDSAGGFGLWYLGPDGGRSLDEAVMVKLKGYGVQALSLPPDGGAASAVRTGLADTALGEMKMLAFGNGGGVLPPAGPAPGAVPLPCPDLLYLVRVGASRAAVARAAAEAGYSPALLCRRLSTVPQEFFQAVGALPGSAWLVQGGAEPDAVPRLVASGAIDASQPVWLYVDLRGVDWRRAALQVRNAAWTAAWQGLAGLAVTCEQPAPEVDRQLVLWHILRDAHAEAALWRSARRAAEATAAPEAETAAARRRRVLALEGIDSVIGPAETCLLLLREERVAFRRLYRVAPPPGQEWVSLEQFDRAYRRTLELGAQLAAPGRQPETGQVYWRGVPLVEAGRAQWAIFAADGEESWRAAVAFQQSLEALTGRTLTVSRTWPQFDAGSPRVVWAFATEAARSALPAQVQAALAARPGAAFVIVDLEGGATAAVASPSLNARKLLNSLLLEPTAFAPARGVR